MRVHVLWPDGEEDAYHAVWLRHNCHCPECCEAHSQHRMVGARGSIDELNQDRMSISSAVITGEYYIDDAYKYHRKNMMVILTMD